METDDDLLFDAVIAPRRSLGRSSAIAVALVLSGLSVSIGAALALLGAWPVLGFSGGEVGLAVVLLLLHARAGRQREHVRLTRRTLHVRRTDPTGRVRVLALPTAWLSLAWDERPGRVPRLLVRRRGAEVELARVLGEGEKRAFGAALADALAGLAAPRFDNAQLRDV